LLASLVCFTHVVSGFTNASLRPLVQGHLGRRTHPARWATTSAGWSARA